jgi:hypothetical protein
VRKDIKIPVEGLVVEGTTVVRVPAVGVSEVVDGPIMNKSKKKISCINLDISYRRHRHRDRYRIRHKKRNYQNTCRRRSSCI